MFCNAFYSDSTNNQFYSCKNAKLYDKRRDECNNAWPYKKNRFMLSFDFSNINSQPRIIITLLSSALQLVD